MTALDRVLRERDILRAEITATAELHALDLAKAESESEQVQAQVNALASELTRLQSTRSWRVTQPLRSAAAHIRKWRRRPSGVA
jgi:hypothetical protein